VKTHGRSIGIAELKAHCSVKLRAIEDKATQPRVFGGLEGTVKILGDIVNAHLEDVEYQDTPELFETRS
jgi:hypothetical protein